MQYLICQRCEKILGCDDGGDVKWCSGCGQKCDTTKISVRHVRHRAGVFCKLCVRIVLKKNK